MDDTFTVGKALKETSTLTSVLPHVRHYSQPIVALPHFSMLLVRSHPVWNNISGE